jgi:glycine/D-amino acid oxidase-like deaminating enzyme
MKIAISGIMNIMQCLQQSDSPIHSFWEHSAFSEVDICIVGAGIIGLSTAIECRERFPQASITILEQAPHGHGATTRNAGFACFGSASELLHDVDAFGHEHAFEIANERYLGLQKLLQRCSAESIKYEHLGGFELIRESELHVLDRLSEMNALAKEITGDPETYVLLSKHEQNELGFSDAVHAVIKNKHEGQLHSGFLHATLERLAREANIRIEFGSKVQSIQDQQYNAIAKVQSPIGDYSLKARSLILANNASISLLASELPIKPGRGQVIVTSPIDDLPFRGAFHIDEGFYYFRTLGNRILLGGGRNLDFQAEETYEFGHTELVMNALDELLRDVIIPRKDYSIEYAWSGLMGFTPDKKPIVSVVSDHVYCAFGCNGMGVALASRIAESITQIIRFHE